MTDVHKHKNFGVFYNHLFKQRVGDAQIKQEPPDESGPPAPDTPNEATKMTFSRNRTDQRRNIRARVADDESPERSRTDIKTERRESGDGLALAESRRDRRRSDSTESESGSPEPKRFRDRRNETPRGRSDGTGRQKRAEGSSSSRQRDRNQSRGRRSRSRRRSVSRQRERPSPKRELKRRDRSRSSERNGKENKDRRKSRDTKNAEGNEPRKKDKKSSGKQSINTTLGVTDINKMKIEDRIKRFMEIFAKKTVGETFENAVQKYFERTAERQALGP